MASGQRVIDIASRESHFAGLFALERSLNFAGASVALLLLTVQFPNFMVAFPN